MSDLQDLFDEIDASTPPQPRSPTTTVWMAISAEHHHDWELWNLIPGAPDLAKGKVYHAANPEAEPVEVDRPPWLGDPDTDFDMTAIIRNSRGEEYAFAI